MPDLTSPDDARGRCLEESVLLLKYFELRGFKPKVVELFHSQEFPPQPGRVTSWGNHFAIIVGSHVVDVTTAQFGAGRPIIWELAKAHEQNYLVINADYKGYRG